MTLAIASLVRLGTIALLSIAIPLGIAGCAIGLRPIKAVLLAVLFKLDIRR